jgi:hypothetical protein
LSKARITGDIVSVINSVGSGVIVNVGVKVGFLVSVRSPIDDVACVAVGKG